MRWTLTDRSTVSVVPGLSRTFLTASSFGAATSVGGVTRGGTELSATQLLQPR